MICCRKCEHYIKDDLTRLSLYRKLRHASGHCMDSNNPDFNEWARNFGRGIKRLDSYITPKWCSKRKNPKITADDYSEEEIHELVKEELNHRKFLRFMKHININDIHWY